MTSTQPVLKVDNIVKRCNFFRPITLVKGISFQINAGEIVAFLGSNGAGKSTTFDMLSGLTFPTQGRIFRYDEETQDWSDISRLPLYKRSQLGICYLPQKPSIFSKLTTRENLLGIMEIMNQSALQKGMREFNPGLKTREEFCTALLQRFQLYEHCDKEAHLLSGGEKRRLEIVRLFIRKPKLILMDEPYAAVDLPGIQLCTELFSDVRRDGVSILIVDHRVKEVLKIASRVIFLHQGEIHFSGTPAEFVKIPLVQRELLKEDTAELVRMFERA
ncbi:MAG: ATP-binding cassette domain-containing protein [Planctomycetia bacterium]|nr:ATP-binding cassette domain-containing protein [Planctomycetia bacterium]